MTVNINIQSITRLISEVDALYTLLYGGFINGGSNIFLSILPMVVANLGK